MSDTVTLITGGSSGIGAATAEELLRAGHRVALTGRNEGRLQETADRLAAGDRVLTLVGDAGVNDQVADVVRRTTERFGRIDNVVANAGFSAGGAITDGDPSLWEPVVLTNVLGPALLVHHALPHLRQTRGRIVMVGSVAGMLPRRDSLYGATKWAVTGLAENVRLAVTGEGIGVTLVAPGKTESAFWDDAGGPPPGEILTSEQIGRTIAWALAQPAEVDVNTLTVRPVGAPA